MKKILILMAVLIVGLLPMVFADEAAGTIEAGVEVNASDGNGCEPPEIYIDHTARGWYPNDQTWYTAELYGSLQEGGKFSLDSAYDRYAVVERMNYIFTGETLQYYIVVVDENGEEDIASVQLTVDGNAVGACGDVGDGAFESIGWDAFKGEQGILLENYEAYDGDIMNSYVCTLIVQDAWQDELEVSVRATDGSEPVCGTVPNIVDSKETDFINFNPTLALSLSNGPIDFGEVEPGTKAISNTVYVGNAAEAGSGVVMDMYIASDDYFTDPGNPDAICPTGNGIRYDQFSYYATKGSINSGANNDNYPGLAIGTVPVCNALEDEFTPLPSHSGDIRAMCRIINWLPAGSLLTQGSEMSVTFQLDVPEPCVGIFDEGQFHIVGRVV